jgi:hypothetical protein
VSDPRPVLLPEKLQVRLEFAAAQFRRSMEEKAALSRVVKRSDLPGNGWAVIEEGTWPTGQRPEEYNAYEPDAEPSSLLLRAREEGSITARRRFEQNGARSFAVQVVPLLSPEDVQTFIKQLPSRLAMTKLRPSARIVPTSDRTTVAREISGVEDAYCTEQKALTVIGDATAMQAVGRVEAFLLTVAAFDAPDVWSWDELVAIAATQAEYLRRLLSGR